MKKVRPCHSSIVFYICFFVVCGLFTFAALGVPASAGEKNNDTSAGEKLIQVGLSLEGQKVEISYGDSYRLVNKASGEKVPAAAGDITLLPSSGGIKVLEDNGRGEVYTGPLLLEPGNNKGEENYFELHNSRFGGRYRGALRVFKNGDELTAVNVLELESYLRGVIPREIPASWGNYGGMEALKAQAVAARSFAQAAISRNRHSDYYLCDTEHCQVYGGRDLEAGNTDQAVSQTGGEVLTYQGRLIAPFYHATNAGYTECASNVWGTSKPYLKSKPDPYDDPDNPLGLDNMIIHNRAVWETSIPAAAVEALLEERGYNLQGVRSIAVESTFPSGRINDLRIDGSKGVSVTLQKEESRNVLGLRSQLFTVKEDTSQITWVAGMSGRGEVKESISELEGKTVLSGNNNRSTLQGGSFKAVSRGGIEAEVPARAFVIEGKGWGHGIGMSQNGAYNRSRDGQDYREILSFYYPGTELTTD